MDPPPAPRDEPTRNLVLRTSEGDEEAFEELFRRYEPLVRWLVRARLNVTERRRMDSSDLLQTCFLKVYRAISDGRYSEQGRFRAWLIRAVENKVRDALRHESAARRDVNRVVLMGGDAQSYPSSEPTPTEKVGGSEQILRFQQAMERLPGDLRDIVLLRDFERLSWPETAARAKCADSTARERHKRAYKLLGDYLAQGDLP